MKITINKAALLAVATLALASGVKAIAYGGVFSTVSCPYDGEPAYGTGATKDDPITREKICQYRHNGYDSQSRPVIHVFWLPCE